MTLKIRLTIALAAGLLSLLPAAAGAATSGGHATREYHAFASWDEGVTPGLENRLFHALYDTLPEHNVLKVYLFDAGGFEAAAIRFSARIPHQPRDLAVEQLDHEAAAIIRTTFERFPKVQTLDVWATIPVDMREERSIESTVFSVSADRSTYESVRDSSLDDADFLKAFGLVWVAPEVPQR